MKVGVAPFNLQAHLILLQLVIFLEQSYFSIYIISRLHVSTQHKLQSKVISEISSCVKSLRSYKPLPGHGFYEFSRIYVSTFFMLSIKELLAWWMLQYLANWLFVTLMVPIMNPIKFMDNPFIVTRCVS